MADRYEEAAKQGMSELEIQYENQIRSLKNELAKKKDEYNTMCKEKDDAITAMQVQVTYMAMDIERAKEDSLSMVEERRVMLSEIDRLSSIVTELTERVGEIRRASAQSDTKAKLEATTLLNSVTELKQSLKSAVEETVTLRTKTKEYEQKISDANTQISKLTKAIDDLQKSPLDDASLSKVEKVDPVIATAIKTYIENGLLVGSVVLPVLASAFDQLKITGKPKL